MIIYLSLVVLKDYGMVPYIKIFLDDECYRSATLSILEQLSVINYEEYMSIIIGALCSSTQWELHLKLDLLKVINVSLTWALFSWELSFFQDGKSRRKKSHRQALDYGNLGTLIFSNACVVNTFTQYQITKCFEDLSSNSGERNGNDKGTIV